MWEKISSRTSLKLSCNFLCCMHSRSNAPSVCNSTALNSLSIASCPSSVTKAYVFIDFTSLAPSLSYFSLSSEMYATDCTDTRRALRWTKTGKSPDQLHSNWKIYSPSLNRQLYTLAFLWSSFQPAPPLQKSWRALQPLSWKLQELKLRNDPYFVRKIRSFSRCSHSLR